MQEMRNVYNFWQENLNEKSFWEMEAQMKS
jgi:hypothetical protein